MTATEARPEQRVIRVRAKIAASAAVLFTAFATPVPFASARMPAELAGSQAPPGTERPMGNDIGGSVAISGSTVLIGASGSGDFRGAAYVDVNPGNGWRRQATINGPENLADFGFSVAVQSTKAGAF